jgi:hypothetical protein
VRLLRLAAATLAAAALVVGCGRGPTEEARVRDALTALAQTTAKKDYRRMCRDVLAPALVSRVRAAGVPCEDALRAGLSGVRNPRLRVRSVVVKGKRATARIHTTATDQPASDDVVSLVKVDGSWRVASLATTGGGSTAPRR